jgi:hypothetical protein
MSITNPTFEFEETDLSRLQALKESGDYVRADFLAEEIMVLFDKYDLGQPGSVPDLNSFLSGLFESLNLRIFS